MFFFSAYEMQNCEMAEYTIYDIVGPRAERCFGMLQLLSENFFIFKTHFICIQSIIASI